MSVTLMPKLIECRERPPAMMWTPAGFVSSFPQLAADANCGRWAARTIELPGTAPAIPRENAGKNPGVS